MCFHISIRRYVTEFALLLLLLFVLLFFFGGGSGWGGVVDQVLSITERFVFLDYLNISV